ncbi:hypothetical protein [Pseudonocardia humida]|uniref:Uncharacterized protein n=1 Tax=Pseudonocardia humida TaxID=2800819 RepID=A0ABT1AD30_9PSEU|nr:hypothetical protein [Pseudonocardia humida]MCO1660828.1 hypothetical protein [Pseudonocardia humida]MCO1661034.1 hypothetical protein [Pseudonocardia humida]
MQMSVHLHTIFDVAGVQRWIAPSRAVGCTRTTERIVEAALRIAPLARRQVPDPGQPQDLRRAGETGRIRSRPAVGREVASGGFGSVVFTQLLIECAAASAVTRSHRRYAPTWVDIARR